MIFRAFLFSMFSLMFFYCNPLTGAPHLYSSSYLEENPYHYTPSHEIEGLTNENLKILFGSVSCDDFKSHIWTHIYSTLFHKTPPPAPSTVQREVKSFAKNYLLKKGVNNKTIRQFAQNFSNIYEQALNFFSDKTALTIMEEIALIELMDEDEDFFHTHPKLAQFVSELNSTFDAIQTIIAPLNLKCEVKKVTPINLTHFPALRKPQEPELHPLVYGARKVMATAYQSCQVLNLPLVHSKVTKVRGIRKISNHEGGGVNRSISSLSQVKASHYYLKKINPTSSSNCPNILNNPLIYDFGGKPFVSMYPYPQINLFKNAGSGSHILGLDCSGFVMSSIATAGLRVKKNKPMKGSYISGISSWLFKDSSNDLNCFDQVTKDPFSKPLASGDVIAVSGHIMIVDQLGKNPLGIKNLSSVSQCNRKNITPNKLNFSIIQSSSDLNAIGINRMHIRSTGHTQLKNGLVEWAIYNCKKKWNPHSTFKNNNISISRHILTPECQEPPMYLLGQECVPDCSS